MAYFHNVQQTRNSGLDREMRLAAASEFIAFVRSKRKLLALKNFTVKEQWAIIPAEKSIFPGRKNAANSINGKNDRY